MDLKYIKETQLKIALAGLIVFLNCITLSAADDDLFLENELEQALPNTNSTSAIPASEQPALEDVSLDTSLESALNEPAATTTDEPEPVAGGGKSEVEYDKDELQVQSIEQEYAMNGYSVGALFFNNNYNIDVNILSNNAPVNLTTKSPDIQSIGVMGRYAILPYDKLGTDINVALATSVNHSTLNYSAISTLRAELNLGYAFLIGNESAVYFLAGLGYEITKNAELEAILNAGGAAYQVGGGIGLGKNIDVEVFYSHVRHAIQDSYLEKAALSVQNNGATVSYVSSKSSVTSNVILGRLSYNY